MKSFDWSDYGPMVKPRARMEPIPATRMENGRGRSCPSYKRKKKKKPKPGVHNGRRGQMGVWWGGTKLFTVEEVKIRDQKMKEAWSSQLHSI